MDFLDFMPSKTPIHGGIKRNIATYTLPETALNQLVTGSSPVGVTTKLQNDG
jgi:hypothetical protein